MAKPKHKSFPTCFIYEGENTSAEVAVCCRKIQQCGIDITASYDHSRMQEVLGEDRDLYLIQLQRNMLATFNSMLVSSLEPLTSTLTDRQQEILNESGYSDLMRNSNSIINCAMLLSLGYIHEATTYAESCGGGSSPDSGWVRDKDEDDNHWWRRCIAVSAAMMRPAKYRIRRSR